MPFRRYIDERYDRLGFHDLSQGPFCLMISGESVYQAEAIKSREDGSILYIFYDCAVRCIRAMPYDLNKDGSDDTAATHILFLFVAWHHRLIPQIGSGYLPCSELTVKTCDKPSFDTCDRILFKKSSDVSC